MQKGELADSAPQVINMSKKNIKIEEVFEPIVNSEGEKLVQELYKAHPELMSRPLDIVGVGSRMYRTGEPWIQTYTGRRFTPTNPVVEAIVIDDIAHPLSMQCRFSGHVKQFYCVTPDTKILTSDLVWKNAGDLQLFEGLVGFDENTGEDGLCSNSRKSRRKMKYSNVLHTGIIKRHVYALHLSNGIVLKSSDEHPWLICSKKSRNQKWETTLEIVKAINSGKQRFMLQFLKPWEDVSNTNVYEENYMLGYLSGIFDGEATINCNRRGFLISISQNPGPVLEKIKACLNYYGFNYSEYLSKKCHNLQLTGTWSDKLRFLNTIKSIRLLTKYKEHLVNNEWRKEFDSVEMLSIVTVEDLGMQDVVALETSSRTYFAEGFGSHNSVAQHSVLVSYICDRADALWGLLHDGSEAYLVDIPRPIKQSGKFDNYLEFEKIMQKAICKRFGMSEEMPKSVKYADYALLMTEARDLMSPLHEGWAIVGDPLPFTITPWSQQEAKSAFIKRFLELYSEKENSTE